MTLQDLANDPGSLPMIPANLANDPGSIANDPGYIMSLLMRVFTVHTVYSINNSFEKCPTDSAQ